MFSRVQGTSHNYARNTSMYYLWNSSQQQARTLQTGLSSETQAYLPAAPRICCSQISSVIEWKHSLPLGSRFKQGDNVRLWRRKNARESGCKSAQFSLKDCTAWRRAGPAACHCVLDAVPPATYTWPLEAAAAMTACKPLPVTNSYLQHSTALRLTVMSM